MTDPPFGDDMGVPWWLYLALGAIGAILVLMIVMIVVALYRTKATKSYAAQRGWPYRSRDRQLAERCDRQVAILRSVPDFVWQDRGGRPHQLAGMEAS